MDVLSGMTPLFAALISFAVAFVAGLLLGKSYLRTKLSDETVPRDRHHKLLQIQRQKYRERVLSLHNRLRDQVKSETRKIANLTAQISQLQESLVTRNHQISGMDTELQATRLKAEKLLEKLDRWKQRVAPLAEKLREQQVLIRRLQEDEKSPSGSVDSSDDSPDNLQKIRGIGPALERRLNNSGIHRFQQIAQMSEKELANIAAELAISPTLAARDGWIKQACELLQHQSSPAKRASE